MYFSGLHIYRTPKRVHNGRTNVSGEIKNMAILKLGSYRKKGINAYAVPLQGLQYSPNDYDFGAPLTDADRCAAYKSGFHEVGVDLSTSKFSDGYLKYREAIGHRSSEGYVYVVAGEIAELWESEADYVIARATTIINLPALEGSPKQIAWAEGIRAKVILFLNCNIGIELGFYSGFFNSRIQSRDWIEGFLTTDPSAIAHMILQELN